MPILIAGCVDQTHSARTVFVITDAAVDMNAITRLDVSVNKIRLHAAGDAATQWKDIGVGRSYDVLELGASNRFALLADVYIEPGTYDQMIIEFGRVQVENTTSSQDARIVNGSFEVPMQVTVSANQTTAVIIDVQPADALHQTPQGEIVFIPVVNLEARQNVNVTVSQVSDIKINGGISLPLGMFSMGISGSVAPGIQIPPNAVLAVNGNVVTIVTLPIDNGRLALGMRLQGLPTDIQSSLHAQGTLSPPENETVLALTIARVDAEHATQGWITVIGMPTRIMMPLNDPDYSQVFDMILPEGRYDGLRLVLVNATLETGTNHRQLQLPAQEMTITGQFSLNSNSATAGIFSILGNQSFLTENNDITFVPIIRAEIWEEAMILPRDADQFSRINGVITVNETLLTMPYIVDTNDLFPVLPLNPPRAESAYDTRSTGSSTHIVRRTPTVMEQN